MEEHIYEDIPHTIAISQASTTPKLSHNPNQKVEQDPTSSEHSQLISSSPNSLDEALGNVEQWSDVIIDRKTGVRTSSCEIIKIFNLLPSTNDYVDEAFMSNSFDPNVAAMEAGIFDGEYDGMKSRSKSNGSLFEEVNAVLEQLYSSVTPKSDESQPMAPSDEKSQLLVTDLQDSGPTCESTSIDTCVGQEDPSEVSSVLCSIPSTLVNAIELEYLSYDLCDQSVCIRNHVSEQSIETSPAERSEERRVGKEC